ncbi:mitochondrial carrier domain-containing protein [Cokeromyces recurvatus]|uniref:mitochondrial carrier domain-containing protein n=1 Tax=Cokeromyces recurvatus TaxID=90255 RepID=UPI0022205862|nr:mitochondrial carrier domain-containing protein [Cokeromyces recurvatus]KAI7907974.1 mitochondrial carrier domain-containing protein [Cokeromyces recurvatus]
MSKEEKMSAYKAEPHPYYDEEMHEKETRIRSLYESLDRQMILSYVRNISPHKNINTIDYEAFRAHILSKEEELWKVFSSINQKGDHRLTHEELQIALKESGIHVTNSDIDALIQFIDTSGNGYIDFESWRNFLLLLPHEPTLTEIYRYYQISTQLNADAEAVIPHTDEAARHAYKYLTAGAIAGCVSRTCTAPLDRLKIYLITNTNYQSSRTTNNVKPASSVSILNAIKTIYKNGGFRGLYVGNGLNVIKIIPESAIKFYVFETSKAIMAQMTGSSDKNSIPISARFIAGGVAGLCSQFCVYPLETLKTRIMSSQYEERQKLKQYPMVQQSKRSIVSMRTVVKDMYKAGGVRAFWPGLLLSMIGVFPYQALDMGVYETLKVSYLRSMDTYRENSNGKKPDPNVMVLWMCGMVSGSIGATSVYPLNMIRTRLQAQGTPAHPYRYTSAWDVARKTYRSSGIRGFYKGLGPTLIKVVPSISISYAVYELSKKSLGIS